MDTLTKAGWSPAIPLQSLFITIAEFICDGKIDSSKYMKEYTYEEAKKQYEHTSKVHRWND